MMKKKFLAILMTLLMLLQIAAPAFTVADTITGGGEGPSNLPGPDPVIPGASDVAQIGETGYETFEAAIAAANADTNATEANPVVVELLTDVNVSAAIMISNHVTLDGGNHTITTSANRGIRIDRSDVTVTVKNLTISGSGMERAIQIDSNKSGITLTIDHVIATATYYTVNIGAGTDHLDVTIRDSQLNGWSAINSYASNSDFAITGSTLYGKNTYSAPSNDYATIVFDGGSLVGLSGNSVSSTLTITDCTIIAEELGTNKQSWISFQYGASYNTAAVVSVSGTSILDAVGGNDKTATIYMTGTGNKITIALTDAQKAALEEQGYVVTENENKYDITVPTPDVFYSNGNTPAQAEENGFDTFLAMPYNSGWMANGEWVTLKKDIVLTSAVTANFAGTGLMYLGEYTLTLGEGGSFVITDGTAIKTDKQIVGVFSAPESYKVVETENGDGTYTYSVAKLPEAVVTNPDVNTTQAAFDTGYFAESATEDGVSVVDNTKNVTVVFDADAAAQIAQNADDRDVMLKVKDVTTTQEAPEGTKVFEITMVTVVNGTPTDEVFSPENADGTATVTVPFTANGSDNPVVVYLVENNNNKTAVPCTYANELVTFTVEHFSTYSVEQLANSVAKITTASGNRYYTSLADAVDAVPTDGTETTIQMIADSTEPAVITVASGKNIVLDLNGKTVSHTSALKSVYFLTNKGTLTIRDTSASGKITMTAVADTGYSVQNVTVYNLGGTLTLKSGTIENMTQGGLTYAVNNSSNAWGTGDDKISTFNMTGGRLSGTNTDNTLRVYQNCADKADPVSHNTVTISGGVIENGIFVDTYLYEATGTPDYSGISTHITISGGTINGLVDLKIRHKYDTQLTIDGGDFTNAALRVRKYESEYKGEEPTEPMVTISGGKFAFESGQAFGASSWTGYAQPYYVTGGVYNVDLNSYSQIKFENGKQGSNNTDTTTNGTYPYTVGAIPVARIGDVYYATLAEAFAAANAASGKTTITLLENVAPTTEIEVNGDVVLDLNGKNIETSKRLRLVKGSFEITGSSGTITTSASGMSPVEVRFDKTNDATVKRTLIIGENVTLTGSHYGLNIFGTNEGTVANAIDVTVNGTVNGTLFVLGNLTNSDNAIDIDVNGTVNGGSDYVGIALNGNADVTVGTNANVSGKTGIEVRAGNLTVNGGTITGTGAFTEPVSNPSGTTSSGAAVAVAQHQTKLPISVTLTGGTLNATGKDGKLIVVGDPENNGTIAGDDEEDKVQVVATESFKNNSAVAEGYKWVASGSNYTLAPITYYTVSFVNGNTTTTEQVAEGEKVEKPSDPYQYGYTFKGWFADGASTAFDFNTAIKANLTLTAQWEAEPQVPEEQGDDYTGPESAINFVDQIYMNTQDQLILAYQLYLTSTGTDNASEGYVHVVVDGTDHAFKISELATFNNTAMRHQLADNKPYVAKNETNNKFVEVKVARYANKMASTVTVYLSDSEESSVGTRYKLYNNIGRINERHLVSTTENAVSTTMYKWLNKAINSYSASSKEYATLAALIQYGKAAVNLFGN